MKRSFLIFILLLLLWVQNDVNAQQSGVGMVFYASKDDIKPIAMESSTSSGILDEKSIATIPFEGVYYYNYYGAGTFEVYAGEAVDLSLVYLKVTTPSFIPITVALVNSEGEEIMRYATVKRPLVIGYGIKPGVYFIHVMQGKKEMVLRFSKGV